MFTNIPGGYVTPNGNVVMSDAGSGVITPNGNVIVPNKPVVSSFYSSTSSTASRK